MSLLSGRRIALVEDDEIMGASLDQRLRLEGAEVIWLKLVNRAVGALRTPRAPIDAVICDIRLPDGTGEELFETLCRTMTPPPFLFITGQGGIDQAVRLLKAGAADYITKPFAMAEFLERLAMLVAPEKAGKDVGLLGISTAARRIDDLAVQAAGSDLPVLIRGAGGTGKLLVARQIHSLSDRRAALFAHANLARAEDTAAALRAAMTEVGEGTIFLNGLCHMDRALQDGLMVWLDRGTPARIVTACGTDTTIAVKPNRVRGDLLHRLNRLEIPIPPLKDRPEDAVWLLHRLFAAFNALRGQPMRGISPQTEAAVRAHDWPENGRELRARLRQAMAVAQQDILMPVHLFPEIEAVSASPASLSDVRDAAERLHIQRVLEACGGQMTEAARRLRISRTTLWEKMQKLGL
ncbi:response regulator [Paracoccaceae bacterium Fryx2]|nr:response regulator [Paracoccaceae bacterium Fryx2]